MIYNISAKDNKTLKLIRQLKRKSGRAACGQFIAEGKRLVTEAFEYAARDIYCVVISAELCQREPELLRLAEETAERVYVVPENIFNGLSDTDTPQGVLAVVNIGKEHFVPTDDTRFVLVLDGVSEPGNMGTVIRTAEAIGFDGVYLMKGCTDIYAPKTVRATMGSIFRLSFRDGCDMRNIEELKENGFTVVSTTPWGELALEQFKTPKRIALVIGNEAHGVSDDVLQASNYRLKITMDGMAESLNAAVAAGIAMHWIKMSEG